MAFLRRMRLPHHDRSGEHKRATGARKVKLVSSVDLPACVVVKSGDAADAGEVLQVSDKKLGKTALQPALDLQMDVRFV